MPSLSQLEEGFYPAFDRAPPGASEPHLSLLVCCILSHISHILSFLYFVAQGWRSTVTVSIPSTTRRRGFGRLAVPKNSS